MPSWKKLISSGSDAHLNAVTASSDIILSPTNKLYLDSGTHTYISETSDDNLKFYVGGTNLLTMIEGGTNVVKVGDGTYLGVGDSTDLYMYHAGGTSFINNGTGRFDIRNQALDQDIRFSVNDGGVTSNILTLNAASSRVGIGTTAPSYLLHLSGTAPELAFTDTDGTATWRARAVTNNFHITETGAGDPFVIQSGAGANALVIDYLGRVGIGTGSPSQKLHISGGNLLIANTNLIAPIYLRDSRASYTAEISQRSDGRISLTTRTGTYGSNGSIEILDSGFVGIGTTTPTVALQIQGEVSSSSTGSFGAIVVGGNDFTTAVSESAASVGFGTGGGGGGISFNGSTINGIVTRGSNSATADVESNLTFDGTDLSIAATGKIYLDGGTDTYIQEPSDDDLKIFVGGQEMLRLYESPSLDLVRVPDDVRLQSGNDGDLQFYHTGNTNFIRTTTLDQDLYIQVNDGGVNTNAIIIDASAEARVKLPNDNQHLAIGAGQDLRLYHLSDTSTIKNYTGGLTIENNGTGSMLITNTSENQDILLRVNDGGVTTDAIRIDASDNARVRLANDNQRLAMGAGDDIQINHDGTNSYIDNYTGHFYITNAADDKDLILRSDDGAGGVTPYLTLSGLEGQMRAYKQLRMQDNVQLQVGSSGDAQFFHNTADTYLQNSTGHLYIQNTADDSDIILSSDDGAGGITPYITLDGGLGYTTSQKDFRLLADNINLSVGASTDLYFYHDGTNSWMRNKTGNLYIRSEEDDKDIILQSDDGAGGVTPYITLDGSVTQNILNVDTALSATKKLFFDGGSDTYIRETSADLLEFYVGNAKLLSMYNSGVDSVRTTDNTRLGIGNGDDLYFVHDGTNNQMVNLTGNLIVSQSVLDGDIEISVNDSGSIITAVQIDASEIANVRLPNDGQKLSIGAGYDLQLHHTSGNSFIANAFTGDLYIQNSVDDKDIILRTDDGAGGVTPYITLDGSIVRTVFDKAAQFNDSTFFPDSSIAYFGTGNDFRIQHNGTANYIQSYNGTISIDQLTTDGDISFRNDDGAGSVTTYMRIDGSDERIVVQKSLRANDNIALAAGTDGDVNLVHDGTNSYVENWNGDLYIRNNHNDKDVKIQSDDNSGGVTDYITLDGSAGKLLLTPPIQTEVQGNLVVEGDITAQNYIVSSSITYMTQSFSSGSTIFGDSTDDTHQFTGSLFISSSVSPTAAIQVGEGNTARVGIKVSSNRTMFGYDGGYAVVQGGTSKGVRFRTNNDTFGTGTEAMTITYGGQVNLPNDSQKLTLGVSQDLELYHDGTNSIINNTTGELHISQSVSDADILFGINDGGTLKTALKIDASEIGNVHLPNWNQALKVGASGNILLYHSSTAAKFVNITGNMEIENQADDSDIILKSDDGAGGTTAYLTLDGSATATKVHKNLEFSDNVQARFGTSDDLQIYHDGSNSVINHAGTGDLQIYQNQDDKDIILLSDDGAGGTTAYITLDGSATNTLFHLDTRLKADGKSLSVGADNDLRMIHDTHSYLQNTSTSMLVIQNTGVDQDISFMANDNGSNNHVMRIQGATGFVGIGTTSPAGPLTIANANNGSWNDGLIIDDPSGWAATVYKRSNSPKMFTGLYYGNDNYIWMSSGYDNTGTTITAPRTDAVLMSRPGTDDLQIYLDTHFGGNVGIGTSSPATTLHVSSSGVNGILLDKDGADNTISSRLLFREADSTIAVYNTGDTLNFRTGATVDSTSGTNRFYINTSGATVVGNLNVSGNSFMNYGLVVNETANDADFRVEGTSDTHLLFTDAANNRVGISTASPDTLLHVDEDDAETAFQVTGGNNGAKLARFVRDIGVASPYAEVNIHAGAGDPQITFRDVGNQYFSIGLDNSNNSFNIATGSAVGGSDAVTINSSGDVGIGTTSPADLLHLYGSGNISQRIQGAGGTANIRFQNDAQSWYAGINASEQFYWYGSQIAATAGFINTNGNLYWNYNFLANNNDYGLVGRDTGGNTRVVAKINSLNQVQIGDSGHGGNHVHYPTTYTQINTDYGTLQLGPQNASHCHIMTDRSNIYSTSYLNINNGETIRSYSQDFVATRAGSSTNKIAIEDGGTRVYNILKAEDGLYIKAQSNSGTSGTDGRQYLNIFSYKNTGAITGAFIIHTDIGRASNKMGKIHVHGHAYGQGETIDFQVVFYMYSGQNGNDGVAGQPYATSIIDNGDDGYNKYLGIDADGNLAIAIDEHNGTSKYFYHFTADMYIGNAQYEPTTDWSGSVSTTDGFNWLHKEAVVPKFHFNSTRYKLQTDNGYIEIGPQNSSYAHYKTDRTANYFDKRLVVDQGIVGSYDEDLILRRADTTSDYISIQDDRIVLYVDGAEKIRAVGSYNYIPQKIYGGDGTAAAPMYNFWNDSDTGMYRADADTLGFTAGGTARATINSAGTLYVSGKVQAGSGGIEIWDATHGFKHVLGKDNTYTYLKNNDGVINFYAGDSGDATNYYDNGGHRFRSSGGGTTYAYLNSTGLAIGHTSPAYKLDVRGSDIYTDGYIRADDGLVTWSSVDGSVLTVDNDGTYTRLRNPVGVGCIAVGDTGDGQNYYDNGAHQFRSYGGGTYFGTLNSTGLGLSNTNPTEKLHVNGNIRTSGNVYIDNPGSDYSPGLVFLGGSNNPSLGYETGAISYFDNAGTGLMRYTINRSAGSHNFYINGSNVFYVDYSGQARITGATDIGLVVTSTDSGGGIAIKDSNTSGDYYNGVFCDGNNLFLKANNTERLRVKSDGNIDISNNLLFGSGNIWQLDQGSWTGGSANQANIMLSGAAGTFGFHSNSSTVDILCDGNIRALADVVAYYSDIRLKEKFEPITNALEKVQSLDTFTYESNDLAKKYGYNDDYDNLTGKRKVGVSAQQVQEILPEAVTLAPFDTRKNEDGTIESISGENYLTVKYEKMVPLLIESIKELKGIVETQQTTIEKQQQQITKLEEKSNG